MSDNPYTIYKLDEDIKATFEDDILPRLKDGENVDDMIHECADSETPAHYSNQLDLARSHLEFMHESPSIGGDNSPMQALIYNIYEHCYGEFQRMVQEWHDSKCIMCEGTGLVDEQDEDGEWVEVKCTDCEEEEA